MKLLWMGQRPAVLPQSSDLTGQVSILSVEVTRMGSDGLSRFKSYVCHLLLKAVHVPVLIPPGENKDSTSILKSPQELNVTMHAKCLEQCQPMADI